MLNFQHKKGCKGQIWSGTVLPGILFVISYTRIKKTAWAWYAVNKFQKIKIF